MFNLIRNKRAQSTLEYVIIVTVIVGALILARIFIQNRIAGTDGGSLMNQADEMMRVGATQLNYESPLP